jgi:hypothetical protein
MYTFKFEGLSPQDTETPYYYGSLPAKPEVGHILVFDQTKNRYVIFRIDGEGLTEGNAQDNQWELAYADISRAESVPTIWLRRVEGADIQASGRSFSAEELKGYSQHNREMRLSAAAK